MNDNNLVKFQVLNNMSWVTVKHEDAAMAHGPGVLSDEDAHGGSHVPGRRLCRDLIISLR